MIPIEPTTVIKDTHVNMLVHMICLYLNFFFVNDRDPDRYRYIAVLDIYELMISIKYTNWMDMLEEQLMDQKEEVTNWKFRNVYFLDNMTDLRDPQPEGKSYIQNIACFIKDISKTVFIRIKSCDQFQLTNHHTLMM